MHLVVLMAPMGLMALMVAKVGLDTPVIMMVIIVVLQAV
jgi:hypothetical protein